MQRYRKSYLIKKKEEETNTLQREEENHIKGSQQHRVADSEVVRDHQSVTSAQGEWKRTCFLVKYFALVLCQSCHNVSKLLFS